MSISILFLKRALQINRKLLFIFLFFFLSFSCGNKSKSSESIEIPKKISIDAVDAQPLNLLEIPVNIDQNISLSLSEITEEMTVIEPELTNESLISPKPGNIRRILLCDNNVMVVERDKISVFDNSGKFIRSLGSKGQGPGEYIRIQNMAIDEKNKRLYINTRLNIICYDLNGVFLKKSSGIQDGIIYDINYFDDRLLILVEYHAKKDAKGLFKHSVLYRLNDELHITDSCTIRDNYFEKPGVFTHPWEDFILGGNSTAYLYHSDIYSDQQQPAVTVLRDTLYRFEKNRLVPELKLKFKNNGIDGGGNKFIHLFNIYRSSRYVFAVYVNTLNNNYYCFCYDTKTGKGYNMQDGYTDETHLIDNRISIRPLNSDTEYFYYWHTHMKPDDMEEPNPTLYIGKLKK